MAATRPKLAGFEFLKCLGQGAFGQVWKARDLGLDVLRAVKIVDPSVFREQDARRLLAEARAVAGLPHHPNRVVVHQIKDGITNCFLIMDYVAGGSLDRLSSPEQPMPWPRAVRYITGVGDGLLEVHRRGLLHRDIKPSNILLDTDRDEAVLCDFGLVAAAGGWPEVAGTRAYMAPEVRRHGRASARSDVYSLAASLLYLVTGSPANPVPAAETSPEVAAGISRNGGMTSGEANWPEEVPEEVRGANRKARCHPFGVI
jgi:serine/threonine protein kinase